MSYSYDPFKKICEELRNSGFFPTRSLDIGANVGQSADIISEIWPKSELLLVEGNDDCINVLKCKNYKVLPILLGKENQDVTFFKSKYHPQCSGNSIYKEKSKFYEGDYLITEIKKTSKLDDVVSEIYDLIKIDTQGSELDVIKGGLKTFSQSKVILIEVSLTETNLGGCSKKDILEQLTRMGFDYIRPFEIIYNHESFNDVIQENLLFIKR